MYNFEYDLFASIYRRATGSGWRGAQDRIRNFARFVAEDSRALGPTLQRIHEGVANEMREATLDAYIARVKNTRTVAPYDRNNRLSGGAERVLNSNNFALGDVDGIKFINMDLIDAEAIHMYRLNFGMQPAPGGMKKSHRARRKIKIVFDKREFSKDISLKNPPRPNTGLPPGFFLTDGKKVGPIVDFKSSAPRSTKFPFYPTKPGPLSRNMSGIRGERFFDAGLSKMAKRLPKEYEKLVDMIMKKAGRKSDLNVRKIGGIDELPSAEE